MLLMRFSPSLIRSLVNSAMFDVLNERLVNLLDLRESVEHTRSTAHFHPHVLVLGPLDTGLTDPSLTTTVEGAARSVRHSRITASVDKSYSLGVGTSQLVFAGQLVERESRFYLHEFNELLQPLLLITYPAFDVINSCVQFADVLNRRIVR